MAINEAEISIQIFKIMKSYGLNLKLYDVDGKQTVNPEKARRFYSNTKNLMINLDTSTIPGKIKVNIGTAVDLKEIDSMLKNIKLLATNRLLGYTLRTFGKRIYPKDFAYQVNQKSTFSPVIEGFIKPSGSNKISKHKFGETTMIVNHRNPIDENIKGARSRSIKSIFIENNIGERFIFPYPTIIAAKAMTIHIENGGNPYDNIGKHIINICEELKQLRKFNKYGKKILTEKQQYILKVVSEQICKLVNTLRSLNSQRNYQKYINEYQINDNFEISKDILSESGIDTTDENIQSTLPYISKILTTIKNEIGYLNTLKSFMSNLVSTKKFQVNSELNSEDPDHPDNLSFNNNKDKISAFASYLASNSTDATMKKYLEAIATDVKEYNDDLVDITTKLLTSLEKIAIVIEQSGNTKNILETHILEIIDTVNKYSFERTF